MGWGRAGPGGRTGWGWAELGVGEVSVFFGGGHGEGQGHGVWARTVAAVSGGWCIRLADGARVESDGGTDPAYSKYFSNHIALINNNTYFHRRGCQHSLFHCPQSLFSRDVLLVFCSHFRSRSLLEKLQVFLLSTYYK